MIIWLLGYQGFWHRTMVTRMLVARLSLEDGDPIDAGSTALMRPSGRDQRGQQSISADLMPGVTLLSPNPKHP